MAHIQLADPYVAGPATPLTRICTLLRLCVLLLGVLLGLGGRGCVRGGCVRVARNVGILVLLVHAIRLILLPLIFAKDGICQTALASTSVTTLLEFQAPIHSVGCDQVGVFRFYMSC
jgi:hypothetical protein